MSGLRNLARYAALDTCQGEGDLTDTEEGRTMSMRAYTVLGVAPDATVAEIRTAYRERARQIHPDRFADDPGRAQAAHEAFVELGDAARVAMATAVASAAAAAASRSAARSVTRSSGRPVAPPAGPVLPQQRRSTPPPRRQQRASAPAGGHRPTVTPIRQKDPVLTLLTVPQRCARPWSASALEVWALTVVPEARRHLSAARRIARASGVASERHLTTATAHALLTLTVNGLNGPRVMGVIGQLDAAYDALEIVLPREVVDRLPARVTARRPGDDQQTLEPDRRLLAFCAASGALAAATVWTHFFGFFTG